MRSRWTLSSLTFQTTMILSRYARRSSSHNALLACLLACVIALSHHAFINNTLQRPMDLGTIRKRLERNGFHSLDSFRAEVQQVWDNAILYNPVEHHVHLAARKFEKMFEERFRALEKDVLNQALLRHKEASNECCVMCAGGALQYEPRQHYCNGPCQKKIRVNQK